MKVNAGLQKNYDKLMLDCMQKIKPGTPLLLHVCCGPCSTSVLEKLADTFAVTLLYYNPNISPPDEYHRRLAEVRDLVKQLPVKYPISLIETDYNPSAFFAAVQGLENEEEGGQRCTQCYRLRLEYAAEYAAAHGFAWHTTTLSVSPHKDAVRLNQLGEEAGQKYGINHLPADFKKRDGYKRSLTLSSQYNLYRQDYCGCVYSLRATQKHREEKAALDAANFTPAKEET